MKNEVLCGDCEELIPTLEDRSVNLVCTSPPYAMQRAKQYGGISEADFPAWVVGWMEKFKPKLTADGSVLINIRTSLKNGWLSPYVLKTQLALLENGWGEPESLIWFKPDAPPIGSRYRPRRSWEHILWFSQSRRPYCQPKACGEASDRIGMVGGRNQFDLFGMSAARQGIARIRDVISVPVAANAKGVKHPAAFPQKLVDVLVKTFCPEGGLVVDPFGGSGTVGLSCIDAGRGFCLMERKPEYASIIRSRIQAKMGVASCERN